TAGEGAKKGVRREAHFIVRCLGYVDFNANLMRSPSDGRGGDRAVKALPSLLLILTVTAAPTGAQESQGGARLTLQAALDLADKQNLDLAAARQRRLVSRAGVQIAKQRPDPASRFTAQMALRPSGGPRGEPA